MTTPEPRTLATFTLHDGPCEALVIIEAHEGDPAVEAACREGLALAREIAAREPARPAGEPRAAANERRVA
jgi:hypothetical protein